MGVFWFASERDCHCLGTAGWGQTADLVLGEVRQGSFLQLKVVHGMTSLDSGSL
jgi:hypothetical protein